MVNSLPEKSAASTVRFVLDGRIIKIDDPSPQETLLQCLRDRLDRKDVKEGCAEGDCGACTVVIGELDGDSLAYRPINSCIRLLPTVDGREIVTASSLVAADGNLHPVQQALVDQHASQCGFCTPGFVMSLFALWLDRDEIERPQIVDAIAGNLCRCTGYRPIIDAGLAMKRYGEPAHWGRADAFSDARRERLAAMARSEPGDSLLIDAGAGFHAPRSLDELAQALLTRPDALVLAGGTDIGLWVTKQLRELPHVVYLGEVRDLRRIEHRPEAIVIGAAVPLTQAFEAVCTEWPELGELALRFASPPVCNSGTLCGNIANGSPIGDSMPALLALGAELELRCGDRVRTLDLADFYLGYRQTALQAGEFLMNVVIPRRGADETLACWKVSKRFDQDISAVCAAVWMEQRDGEVARIRMGFGGMAAVPSRAPRAEAALSGKALSMASIEAAGRALGDDFTPLTDMRASSQYRLRVAANLLHRLLPAEETIAPSRLDQLDAEALGR